MAEIVTKKASTQAIVKPTDTAQSPSIRLLSARGNASENGCIEWGFDSASSDIGLPLTASEKEALKRKHKTPIVNWGRAMAVKGLLKQGKSIKQMAAILAPLGAGYGERMIAADRAALSECK